jgi:catechol 2,3-dioxygenase-like lactoylglutathione lyase family enzyme
VPLGIDIAIVLLALFAGLPVRDLDVAFAWYERLLGSEPSFRPNDTEAVWELAEHRSIYVVLDPSRAGSALVTVFVDDLEARVEAMGARGLAPARRETYDNGVSKVVFRDPDGNELGFGGVGT